MDHAEFYSIQNSRIAKYEMRVRNRKNSVRNIILIAKNLTEYNSRDIDILCLFSNISYIRKCEKFGWEITIGEKC